MSIKTFLFTFVVTLCCLLPSQEANAADKRLSLSGSSTIAPLISEIARRFEAEHKDFRIDVQTGGSSRGIADARRGLSDIGMSSRALHDEEKAGVKTHILAMDGIAFVVHAKNPIKNLSAAQARQIYTGQISNWKQLGGEDAEMTIIDRAKGRSEQELMTKFLGIKSPEVKANLTCGENQQCLKLVTGNAHAITYLSVGTSEYEVNRGTPIRLLDFEGIPASVATVKDQSFPLVRPLVLITPERLPEEVEEFLNYSLSNKVDDLIKGQAFVSTH